MLWYPVNQILTKMNQNWDLYLTIKLQNSNALFLMLKLNAELTTPCPRKKSSVFISSFSPSNLGQSPKSGTVLISARSQLSKTVPDFEI